MSIRASERRSTTPTSRALLQSAAQVPSTYHAGASSCCFSPATMVHAHMGPDGESPRAEVKHGKARVSGRCQGARACRHSWGKGPPTEAAGRSPIDIRTRCGRLRTWAPARACTPKFRRTQGEQSGAARRGTLPPTLASRGIRFGWGGGGERRPHGRPRKPQGKPAPQSRSYHALQGRCIFYLGLGFSRIKKPAKYGVSRRWGVPARTRTSQSAMRTFPAPAHIQHSCTFH